MSPEPVYLDTFALVALASRADGWHARAKAIEAELAAEHAPLITSDWVLTEFLDAGSSMPLRAAACRVVQRLRASPRTSIIEATRADWDLVLELFEARPDKDWSFTDCSSIMLCQARPIRRIFTHDHHFAQAGFDILLP